MDFPITIVEVVGKLAFLVCATVGPRHWMKPPPTLRSSIGRSRHPIRPVIERRAVLPSPHDNRRTAITFWRGIPRPLEAR